MKPEFKKLLSIQSPPLIKGRILVGFLFKTKIELPYKSFNLSHVKILKLVQRLSAFFILLFYLTCCQPADLVPPVHKSTAYNYLQTVADQWQLSNTFTAKYNSNDNKNNLSFY
ncbi:hypothetical protein Cri9333_2866 [Crinalium epipsammum PCC 9333]|uniref:Uncharacterized protein n=1 Tax=Crinalium epipsammum PCC 9333 TaxID=1173022 RepID=K9VZZ3_9CYAN|nr:hypothetical protein [Crinalium epipsammum]AFZ13708.1 hypothetical protein Cri9333_2866 [Crinalium epipsammum PCC 9333]